MIRRSFWYSMTQATTLALSAALAGCGAAEEGADGPPVFGASNPSAPGGNSGTPQNGPAQNPASGAPGATNPNNPSQAAGSGSTPGASPGGSAAPSGTEGNGTPNAPLAPSTANNSGGAMAPGTGGAGSMPPTGQEPSGTPTPPVTNPPVTNPPVTTPSAPDTACPAGASFCSGFEGTGLPAGSQFEPSYLAANALGTEMRLDTTVFHTGRQSLHMPVGSNYYRMLSVPVPSNTFWVRLYTRSNVGFGAAGSTHATLFMGSIVAPGGDYNADRAVEIAEQFGQVLLNVKDSLFGTSGTNPNGMPGTRLPNDTWTCMEAEFDGGSGDVRVFVEGEPIIDAAGWQPPTAYKSFRFGYLRFSSPERDVWMDDVVVAPTRIGCQ